jgi:hypothetical protein
MMIIDSRVYMKGALRFKDQRLPRCFIDSSWYVHKSYDTADTILLMVEIFAYNKQIVHYIIL